MKQLIRYRSDLTGKVFETAEECEKHDSITAKAEEIMRRLRTVDPDELMAGKAYLQQDPAAVNACKNAILDLHEGNDDVVAKARQIPASFSIIGRYFDDGDSPLRPFWYRLMRIDHQGREWEQCYFANNPEEGARAI